MSSSSQHEQFLVEFRVVGTSGPKVFRVSAAVDPEQVGQSSDAVMHCLDQSHQTSGGDSRLVQRLIRATEALTEALLDPFTTSQLSQLPDGSQIEIHATIGNHRIPWELLRCGDRFLCEQHAVSRVVTGIPLFPYRDERRRESTVLIVHADELVATTSEMSIVKHALWQIAFNNKTQLGEPRTVFGDLSLHELLGAFENSGWVHFAGHAYPDEDEQKRNLLFRKRSEPASYEFDEEFLAGPDQFRSLTSANAQVAFLNACAAMRVPDDDTNVSCLVSVLLEKGVKWLIGPVAPILDFQNLHIVEEFYRQVSKGTSISTAMWRARGHAIKTLNSASILPLCYVVYGPATGHPFPPCSTSLAQQSTIIRKSMSTLNEHPLKDAFPLQCKRCGRRIETRHGLADPDFFSSGDPVCRTCRNQDKIAAEKPRTAKSEGVPTGNVSPTREAPTSPSSGFGRNQISSISRQNPVAELLEPNQQVFHELMQRRVDNFKCRVAEAFAQCIEWDELLSGRKVKCRITLQKDSAQKLSTRFAERSPSIDCLDVDRMSYLLTSERASCPKQITVLLCRNRPTSDCADAPLSLSHLRRQLDKTAFLENAVKAETHAFLLVVSFHGFAPDCFSFVCDDGPASLREQNRTVLLCDADSMQVRYRNSDLAAHSLASLMSAQSIGEQFATVVEWLDRRLPSPVALGSHQIAAETKCDESVARAGLRHVAARHSLRLDETSEFGLVMTQPGSALPVEPQRHAPSSSLLLWFRRFLMRPFRK